MARDSNSKLKAFSALLDLAVSILGTGNDSLREERRSESTIPLKGVLLSSSFYNYAHAPTMGESC